MSVDWAGCENASPRWPAQDHVHDIKAEGQFGQHERCEVDIAPQIHAKSQQSPPDFPFKKGETPANFQILVSEANPPKVES